MNILAEGVCGQLCFFLLCGIVWHVCLLSVYVCMCYAKNFHAFRYDSMQTVAIDLR